jgi:hypothetical protein
MAPTLASARKDAEDASKGDSEVDDVVAPLPRSLSCSPWLCMPVASCAPPLPGLFFIIIINPGVYLFLMSTKIRLLDLCSPGFPTAPSWDPESLGSVKHPSHYSFGGRYSL